MWSSKRNCEKALNFLLRNWNVKFTCANMRALQTVKWQQTVVFMMPVPCVRIEFAM